MAKFRTNCSATAVAIGFLLLAGGCVSTPAPEPAAALAKPTEPAFLQLDDEHLIRLKDVRAAQFEHDDSSSSIMPYYIQLDPSSKDLNSLLIGYHDKARATEAWKRLVAALGGTVHADASSSMSTTVPSVALPTTRRDIHIDPPEEDGYTRLTQQLGWLMKCVDAKLLTDAEYQQGRAWAIAELQANPLGNGGGGGGGGTTLFQHGNPPDFERLYHQLASLAKGKESGLLNEDEAAKVRASIVKQAGLVE